jgi:protein gp37
MHPHALEIPMHWKRPRRVFVCSMGDLFHEDVAEWFIEAVFDVMRRCPRHTFQVLTKRPARMREFIASIAERQALTIFTFGQWPLPNVWLGTTIWDQASADANIPLLLQTPAAKRFVSCEPLLGPVDLQKSYGLAYDQGVVCVRKIDWCIVGGETGPGARPMHQEWVRRIRDDCEGARVPFFFKGWGEWWPLNQMSGWVTGIAELVQRSEQFAWPDGQTTYRVGKRRAGCELDGVEYRAWPT